MTSDSTTIDSTAVNGNNSLKVKKINLTHESALQFHLFWDSRRSDGDEFDLDIVAFMMDYTRKTPGKEFFISYLNQTSPEGTVSVSEDNRTGSGNETDPKEILTVKLAALEPEIQRIAVLVCIYDGVNRKQTFGMVENAWVTVVDRVNNVEIAKFDLTEDAAVSSCAQIALIAKVQGDWKANLELENFEGDLLEATKRFGIKAKRE